MYTKTASQRPVELSPISDRITPRCRQRSQIAHRAIERGAGLETTGNVTTMWLLSTGGTAEAPEALIQPSSEQEEHQSEQGQDVVYGHSLFRLKS
jgi:hypothetical protein